MKRRRRNQRQRRRYAARQHIACRLAALGQALQVAEETNQNLALTNTSLRNQAGALRRLQNSWKQEKVKFEDEKRSLQSFLLRKYVHARNVIYELQGTLQGDDPTDKAFRRTVNKRLQASYMHEEKRRHREEEMAKELKKMHEKCQQQEEVILKKDKLISSFKEETLKNKHVQAVMWQKGEAHNESKTKRKIKCEAREVRLERAERDKEPEAKNKKKKRIKCVRGKKTNSDRKDKHAAV